VCEAATENDVSLFRIVLHSGTVPGDMMYQELNGNLIGKDLEFPGLFIQLTRDFPYN
jgi:hypothetical protein